MLSFSEGFGVRLLAEDMAGVLTGAVFAGADFTAAGALLGAGLA